MCVSAVHRAGRPEPELPEQSREEVSKQTGSAQRESLQSAIPAPSVSVDDEFPVETPADLHLLHFSRSRKILLAAAAATVLFAGSWLISPRDFSGSGSSASASQQSVKPLPAKPPEPAAAETSGLQGMRKLAEQGDPAAQFSVGARYATGEDVPQDYAEAVRDRKSVV